MKLIVKLLALSFGALMLATIANAESPREQFRQMVERLQQNPGDNALRLQIIKLAQELKPAPAVPAEAERFEGRARFAFDHAKSLADYLDATSEYEKASAAAPWVPGYYADLCTIYEKAEKYAEAKKSCEFFLASSPSAQDASDVRKRIAGLEFAIEKANSPAARTANEKVNEDAFLRSLDGARYFEHIKTKFFEVDKFFEIHNDKLSGRDRITAIYDSETVFILFQTSRVGYERSGGPWIWQSGRFVAENENIRETFTPSKDGQMLYYEDYSKRVNIYSGQHNIQRQ